jgi:serine/threonine-protein kinase RsbW
MDVNDTIHLDLPAAHRFLSALDECLSELVTHIDGVSEPEASAYAVQLAVHEACTNIVDHAYENQAPGRILVNIAIENTPPRIIVELSDTGRSFDPKSVPMPKLDSYQVHGYGLYLMHQLMDEVTYKPLPNGNLWRLVKKLS